MSFSVPLSSEPITLEAVKLQIAQWRAVRVKGGRIPNALWERVLSLTKKYGCRQVASELKINPHRLRTKMERRTQSVSSSPSVSTDFIELPFSSLSSSFSKSSLDVQKMVAPYEGKGHLEFTRPDGSILKASGINHQDLCLLIKGFLGL